MTRRNVVVHTVCLHCLEFSFGSVSYITAWNRSRSPGSGSFWCDGHLDRLRAQANSWLQRLMPVAFVSSMDYRPRLTGLRQKHNDSSRRWIENVQIIPEQPNALDLQLELGATTETVTVSDTTQALDTKTATIGGTNQFDSDSEHAIVRL